MILDRLVDAATRAPTSGLYYPDSTPKASAAVVGAAAVVAQRGSLVCPGVQAAAGASALVFPTAVANGTTTSVQLGCARDCLYLITLERADGIPVVARRGALTGGGAPKAIALPKAQLAAGDVPDRGAARHADEPRAGRADRQSAADGRVAARPARPPRPRTRRGRRSR